MTITRSLVTGVISISVLTAASAQDSASQWVKKLSSANYGEREKAARALEEIGADALPHLDKLLASADLETKRRAKMIGERIENRVLIDEFISAKPLRLRVKDLPLERALRSIEQQTGLTLGNAGDEHQRVINLDTGTLPYWQAWQRFCQAAGLAESDYTRSAAKLSVMTEAALADLMEMISRRDNVELQYRLTSPRMEFAPTLASANYSVDDRHSIRIGVKWLDVETILGTKPPQAVFAMEVRAEPRLDIAPVPRVEITKVVDSAGRELAIKTIPMLPESQLRTETADFLAGYSGEIQFGGLLHLRALSWPYPVGVLKEVHGHLRAEVSLRPRMMTVKNVLNAAGQEVRSKGGITLKVLEAKRTEGRNVHLSLRLANVESLVPRALEQQVTRTKSGVLVFRGAGDFAMERLQLLDSKGISLPLQQEESWSKPGNEGKGHDLEVFFAAAGNATEDMTLVFNDVARLVSVQMPFLVRNVAPPTQTRKE